MVLNHSFSVSGGGFDGFDIGNAKSFTHNRAVNMVAPSCLSNISSNMDGKFDIRLKENFKMFVSGPSRCGKTVFVSKLLENIHAFAKIPPAKVLYIYKVWQPKYDEIMSLGVNFIKDSDEIVNDIKSSVSGQPMLVIFDDLIGSSSLKVIADLFTVDARHMNMSLVFLTQRMFVNNEAFRQISQNCDYFVRFKNPRNSSEIRTLAQQMTPGNFILVQIFMEATKGAFSYLFINLTQECDPKMKYLSDLFDNLGRVNVYIVEGPRYRMDIGYGKFSAIAFKNNSKQMMQFIPYHDRTYNQQIYLPRLSNITHIGMPQTNLNDDHVRYELKNVKGTSNIVQNTPTVETVGVNSQTQPMQYAEAGTNTNLANDRFAQTQPMQYSKGGTNTNLPSKRFAQTQPMQYSEAGPNTNLHSNRFAQTQPIHTQSTNTPSQNHISNLNEKCQCEDNEEEDTGLQYQSEFARSLQQSIVIPKYYTQKPVTNYNSHTEKPNISQTESSTIYHIPQESISHTQPPAIQYTQQPVTNYISEGPRETESPTIYHIPQQSISHTPIQSIQHTQPSTIYHTQPPAIQYRQTHGIENIKTDAINYQAQQLLHVPQAITHTERPTQTESSTIYHIPQQSISHTQPHALQYIQQRTIHQLSNQESIQPSKIQPSALQYRQTHGIENMETDAIDFQAQQLPHVPQAITHPERPRQTESSTIYHIPQQSISHAQPPALQYTQQKT